MRGNAGGPADVGWTLLIALGLGVFIELIWSAARHFDGGSGLLESLLTPLLALVGAAIIRRAWRTRHDSRASSSNSFSSRGGDREGWYPDPRVAPPRWRWWDGTQWTNQTRTPHGYLYGMCIPVTGKFSRIWNAAMALCVTFVIVIGVQFAFRHLFPLGDPSDVYVDRLHRVVNPKTYIEAHCTESVRSVDHLISAGTRHALFVQVWSVDPRPGHVDRAYFDASTGTVTCP